MRRGATIITAAVAIVLLGGCGGSTTTVTETTEVGAVTTDSSDTQPSAPPGSSLSDPGGGTVGSQGEADADPVVVPESELLTKVAQVLDALNSGDPDTACSLWYGSSSENLSDCKQIQDEWFETGHEWVGVYFEPNAPGNETVLVERDGVACEEFEQDEGSVDSDDGPCTASSDSIPLPSP